MSTKAGGVGGTPPGAAIDQFLRDAYDVVQVVYENIDSIRAVADHLTPVEDLVEFRNEVAALYAQLNLLVAAAHLIAQATAPGIAILAAPSHEAQRTLLQLKSAALQPESYFAKASEFAALSAQVAALSAEVAEAIAAYANAVTDAELAAALGPILSRLLVLENWRLTVGPTISGVDDRVTDILSNLNNGSYNSGLQTQVNGLTSGLTTVQNAQTSQSSQLTVLGSRLTNAEGTLTGTATAIQGLVTRVTLTEGGIESFASDFTVLNTQVSNLETDQSATSQAVNDLSTRTFVIEGTVGSQSSFITSLQGNVTDLQNGVALSGSAIDSLETRMTSNEAGQLVVSSAITSLGASVTDLETQLTTQAGAVETLQTRVEVTEDGLSAASVARTELQASLTSVGNLLPNSGFEVSLRGWFIQSRGAGWLTSELQRSITPTPPGGLPPGTETLSVTASGVPSGVLGIRSSNIPVSSLNRYILSGYLASENCTVRLEWRILDANNAQIGFGVAGAAIKRQPKNNLNQWIRVEEEVTVPSDGVILNVEVWVSNCNTDSPRAWLLRPMLETAAAAQVNASPWVDSVSGLETTMASATQELIAEVEEINGDLSILAASVTNLNATIGNIVDVRVTHFSGTNQIASGSPLSAALRKANNDVLGPFARGFNLLRFDATNALVVNQNFDTFSNDTERTNLATALGALSEVDTFILVSQDNHGIKQAGLTAAIEACGGNLYKDVTGSRPYILIGRGGLGKGNGLEYAPLAGKLWQDVYVKVINGIVQGAGIQGPLNDSIIAQATAIDTLSTRVTSTENSITSLSESTVELENLIVVKNRIYVQPAMPGGSSYTPGDLWIDTDDGNKIYSWNGSAWVLSTDQTFNNRATVWAQASAPVSTNHRVNDLWFDTDDNNRVYRWDGSSWGDVSDPRTTANASAISSLNSSVSSINGTVTAQATSITNLQTSVGNNTASINSQQTVLNGLSATASLTLDVNGYVTGYRIVNNGNTSDMRFNVGNFGVYTPDGLPAFTVTSSQTINGTFHPAVFEVGATYGLVTHSLRTFGADIAVSPFSGRSLHVYDGTNSATVFLAGTSGITSNVNHTMNGQLTLAGNILSSTGTLFLRPGGGTTDRASLDSSGNLVCIGNVSGYSSDRRLKMNLVPIFGAIDKVKQFGGYTFEWDMELCAKVGFTPNNRYEHGLIAQEIQQVVPDAVTRAGFSEHYLTVNYPRVIPVLVEAIKEQQMMIEELVRAVKRLQEKQ